MNDEMDDLLRAALARRRAPVGFATRVTAKLPETRKAPAWKPWAAIGLAASLLVGVGGVRYREYREGQRAKEQLFLALEITSEKLAFAQHKVDELSQRRID